MNIKRFLFAALCCVVSQAVLAQAKRISGTVTDNEGPVMMANVVEVDANDRIVSATQTDFNGNFSMQVKSPKNKLKFSYVGDKTKVVAIGNQTSFKIVLQPESTMLQEVTVKAKRSNSGGLMMSKKEVAVSQQMMDMSSVEGLSFTSADEALQGEIAGLDIVSNSGNLGAGTTMRLRGVTTINGDANPLIVVDEQIFDNPDENFDFSNASEEQYASLLSVNVEDIANIQVLKDAAATAVWGVNGSNGVIKITTKRGSRGKTRINFKYMFSGTWQPEGYKLLNGDDYTMLMKEAFYNPQQASTATTDIYELNYLGDRWAESENWNNNTDWVDEVTQFGQKHDYSINLSGGGQKATFRISAGYTHQTGTIIKQVLDRFTTRLALDFNVSERIRFNTNFSLTYTDNQKNYSDLLGAAQKLAPNMSVYRQDYEGANTDEYYIMNPVVKGLTPADGNYSSYELRDIRNLGNPVAIANLASKREKVYRINPDFNIKYELLGIDEGKHRLTFNGRVYFDIYANSSPTYCPASLSSNNWSDDNYNVSSTTESNRFKINGRTSLTYTPYFGNDNWSGQLMAQYEMGTERYTSQSVTMRQVPTGLSSPTVPADLNTMTSSSSKYNSQNLLFNGYISYKERYVANISYRMDGTSRLGPKNKWVHSPGVSLRYNVSEENFFKPWRETVSLLSLRASWGIVGKQPGKDYLFYNSYNTSSSQYGPTTGWVPVASLDGMKLDDLNVEKTESYNLGFNIGLFKDKVEVDFDYYNKKTTDLLMTTLRIPSMTGFPTLAYANVGTMKNEGWELNLNLRDIVKKGKFSVSASFNVAQNANKLTEMNETVLNSLNAQWEATSRGSYVQRVAIGAALGSIYGFRSKGVYQYSYDYLENYRKENGLTTSEYETYINNMLAQGKTAPVATDAQGKVLMDKETGKPKRMVYNYSEGSQTYQFQGGDLIYEDINHDGQINQLDVVYLGNSQPKVNGGFNLTLKYGNFSIKGRFMYRFGNKVVNFARMELEKMYTTYNQSATVNYRWRKDGDVTPVPRAMYNTAYNWQGSDRYVEDGSFVRFQNLQLAYSFPSKQIKKLGINQLQLYFSMDNLYCWTKYSGTDPEVSPKGWGVAEDKSQTPRAKQFTASINIGF